MTLIHLVVLAVIQGLTEFLPISSSGHLILLPSLMGVEDQGQAIDVAVHVGTLGAVILYFHQDARAAVSGAFQLLAGQTRSGAAQLALRLVVATVPVVVVGAIIVATGLAGALRSTALIGWTMLLFGLLLWWADRSGSTARSAPHWTLRHALILGLWQAVALIPGTSRSGIVITGARALGYDRTSAAKLAMLMSITAILASGAALGWQVASEANAELARDAAIAAAFAFGAALLALAIMFRLLRSVSFTPYVIYRVALGLVLLAIAYG